MDDEIVGMIRDNFSDLRETCQGIREDIQKHVENDEIYYRKIDHIESQIGMLKGFGAAIGSTGFVGWLVSRFWGFK